MTDIRKNYIAGEWVTGPGQIDNINPSDLSDVIGTYAQASAEQLDHALDAAKSAQAEWAAYGLERKQAVLNAIGIKINGGGNGAWPQLVRLISHWIFLFYKPLLNKQLARKIGQGFAAVFGN